MTDDAPPGETLHMWRLVEVYLDPGDEAKYVCDLCGETLVVPAGGVHPREC